MFGFLAFLEGGLNSFGPLQRSKKFWYKMFEIFAMFLSDFIKRNVKIHGSHVSEYLERQKSFSGTLCAALVRWTPINFPVPFGGLGATILAPWDHSGTSEALWRTI